MLNCSNGYAYLTLDRPRVRNRLSEEMAVQLRDACRELGRDSSVRVVVLVGQGTAFSCGWEHPRHGGGPIQAAFALAALEKPVIAALNGDATDHGLELALACDIRIAAEGSRMGMTMLRHGIIPGDGGTQRLPRIVGRAKALELLLTGTLLDAREAQTIGLVNRVVPSKELTATVHTVAATILDGAPIAEAYAKEAVLHGLDMTLGQGLRLEADLNFLLHSSRDRGEGLGSFLERRKPQFRGE